MTSSFAICTEMHIMHVSSVQLKRNALLCQGAVETKVGGICPCHTQSLPPDVNTFFKGLKDPAQIFA